MKICYLGENISVHNQKWIKALSSHEGVEVHVITFDRGVKFEGVKYYYLKEYTSGRLNYLLNISRVRKLVRQIMPDLLHAHYATSYGFMGACCNFHPFIITGWGADIFDTSREVIVKHLLKFAFRKADAITVLSEITKKEIAGLTKKYVHLVPFGVDTTLFRPAVKILQPGIFRIGTIRTLSEKYGVEFLVRAFAKLSAKYPHTYLEIVGDGGLRKSLETLCDELQVSERVRFYGFVNQQTDFEKYYSILSQFDVFVIPSVLHSETFGVACVEAGACGIPVIASDVGGLPEVIRHGETGFIVSPGNPEAIVQAVEKLIVDKELRISMGKAGREYVLENYDWEKCVLKMLSLYSSLINH
jgi:glycosyltransferase involved in cell wall biosynthesis